MYLELIAVDDKYARSLVCEEELGNGAFAKVKGLATMTRNGVDLSGETYEVEALTDAKGDLFVLVAPEHHEYDERVLSGDTPNVAGGKAFRGYLVHRGMEVRVEMAHIDGEVEVGDKVSPKASGFKLTKSEGAETNVLGTVVAKGTRYGRQMVSILFA